MKRLITILTVVALLLALVPAALADDATGAKTMEAVLAADATEDGGDGLGASSFSGAYAAETDCAVVYADLSGSGFSIFTPGYVVTWKDADSTRQLLAVIKICSVWDGFAELFDSPLKLVVMGSDEESGIVVQSAKEAAQLLEALGASLDA